MQVSELLKLADWFKQEIDDPGILIKFKEFKVQVERNGNSSQKISFEVQKENLFEIIKIISFDELSLEQIDFLDKLNIKNMFGKEGINQIEEILFKNNLDMATAIKRINALNSQLNNAKTVFDRIRETLESYFEKGEDEIKENEVQIRVYFKESASINNIVDLKKYAELWHEIGRGIALSESNTPEDFRVISAEKGSIIINMAVIASAAYIVSEIIIRVLTITEKILNIRKLLHETKSIKMSNSKEIEKEYKKEIDKEKKDGAEKILNIIKKDLSPEAKKDGEVINALRKSINDIIDFSEKGGVVDILHKENVEDEEDVEQLTDNRELIKKLNENIEEVRKLEQTIKQLEAPLEDI